ncbi:MAG TPA: hypothetical protein VKD72_04765 [Gemmataceae bacterium]|nr:hypothetical protein [Gemmataceae bacterium]
MGRNLTNFQKGVILIVTRPVACDEPIEAVRRLDLCRSTVTRPRQDKSD